MIVLQLAGMCQKEVKKTALKSLKASKDYQTRAKRLVKEVHRRVCIHWVGGCVILGSSSPSGASVLEEI